MAALAGTVQIVTGGASEVGGRIAEPDEIASMAVYLASDDSSFSTGAQFVVDGGLGSAHPAM